MEKEDLKKHLITFREWLFDQGLEDHPIEYIDDGLIAEYMEFIMPE